MTPLITALGHRFDEELRCESCRKHFDAHQLFPWYCPDPPELREGQGAARRKHRARLERPSLLLPAVASPA